MRPVGLGIAPLPIDRVVWYLEHFAPVETDDDMRRAVKLVRRMDKAYMDTLSKRQKAAT